MLNNISLTIKAIKKNPIVFEVKTNIATGIREDVSKELN